MCLAKVAAALQHCLARAFRQVDRVSHGVPCGRAGILSRRSQVDLLLPAYCLLRRALLTVDSQAWMVVHGDSKDGAGLHMVEIAGLRDGDKKVSH